MYFFPIFLPITGNTFAEQLADIEDQVEAWLRARRLPLDNVLQGRLYMTDAMNQVAFLSGTLLASLRSIAMVEQPPLSGHKVALQLWVADGSVTTVGEGDDWREVETNGLRLLFHHPRIDDSSTAYEQTYEAFRNHCALLDAHGRTLAGDCHRTWLYVRDIDRDYAEVVRARNDIFAQHGLTASTHFIASTGIGGATSDARSHVAVDFLSAWPAEASGRPLAVDYLHATDYLNPTHEYGVAFERGAFLPLPDTSLILISGTASIDRHGQALFPGDVQTQAGRLFLNIEKLLESAGATLADMQYFLVYLRDPSDFPIVNAYMRARFPHTPFVITLARVCRPVWLIEVEGMAQCPRIQVNNATRPGDLERC